MAKSPIRTLIEDGVKRRHRSMFVIVGDKSRDQIVKLHRILSKSMETSVLWCYKNRLDISSHNKEEPGSLSRFLDKKNVSHCFYKDSEQILGNTFGMCILQDFEALTPNLLARTIETVKGGGLVVLLLPSLASLESLRTMDMDVHDTFRTESYTEAAGRFNERFLLSLKSCEACVVTDDELKILPLSSHISFIRRVATNVDSEGLCLKRLEGEEDDRLFKKCCTSDQGEAVARAVAAGFFFQED